LQDGAGKQNNNNYNHNTKNSTKKKRTATIMKPHMITLPRLHYMSVFALGAGTAWELELYPYNIKMKIYKSTRSWKEELEQCLGIQDIGTLIVQIPIFLIVKNSFLTIILKNIFDNYFRTV